MPVQMDPIEEFRADHRKIRDNLLDLAAAIRERDLNRSRDLLSSLDKLTGPHFRFEEEALYPALREFLGEYVDKLIAEHDDAIGKAHTLSQLLGGERLAREDAEAALTAVQSLLIHVTDCDGLAILMEKFSEAQLADVLAAIVRARGEGLPLIQWAATVRGRGR